MSKIDYRIELDDHSQDIDRKHGKIMQKSKLLPNFTFVHHDYFAVKITFK